MVHAAFRAKGRGARIQNLGILQGCSKQTPHFCLASKLPEAPALRSPTIMQNCMVTGNNCAVLDTEDKTVATPYPLPHLVN